MNAAVIAVFAFVGIIGATVLGLRLHAWLPDHQLSAETKDTVRLGMGLVATMTALLLGLLIASAKGSYDTQRSQTIQMAAKAHFLDRVLALYGSEATDARTLLRGATQDLMGKLWPEGKPTEGQADPAIAGGPALYSSIQRLAPQNDEQRALKAEALDTATDLSQTRWLLFAQANTSIPTPLLIMVIVWLAIIFLSFGLFAPTNKTVLVTMIIVALAVSSALFLILELDRPFDGLIHVPKTPVQNALGQMGR